MRNFIKQKRSFLIRDTGGYRRRFSICLLLGCLMIWPGCEQGQNLRQIAPDLSPEVARLLARSQVSDLGELFQKSGTNTLTHSFDVLYREAVLGDQQTNELLLPYLETLAGIMAEDFKIQLGQRKLASMQREERAILRRAYQLNHERDALFANAAISDSTKVKQLHGMAAFFNDHGLLWYTVALDETLAQVHASMGEREDMRQHLQAALRGSRETDFAGMTCQILGTMAEIFYEEGQLDSARVYVDFLQDRAVRSRLALQAARSETFRCSFSLGQGRLHGAHLHLKEARRLCRDFQGGQNEAIYVSILARFYANLGCWSIVEGLLEQTDVLLGDDPPEFLQPTAVDLALLKAETLFERGQRASAHQKTAAILANAQPRPHRLRYALIAWHRARLLLADNRPDEAMPVVSEGLRRAQEDNLPGMDSAFNLQMARTLEQQGQVVAAQQALSRFWALSATEEELLPGDLELATVLAIRLAWTSHGDSPQLVQAVARGFASLQRRLAGRDPSAHTYLHIEGFDELREQVHGFVADDPELGLAFEMAWRRLARLRSEGEELRKIGSPFAAPRPQNIIEWTRRWTTRVNGTQGASQWLITGHDAPARTTFLLYSVIGADIYRWQVDHNGLQRNRLGLDAARMRPLVAHALNRLATPPGKGVWDGTGPLADDLSVLARELIPGGLRRRWLTRQPFTDPEILLIAADDALTRIPFEALDLDLGSRYLPLDDPTVVSYLRYVADATTTVQPESMLILADPDLPPALRRRYPDLGALPGARREAARVARVWTQAPLLVGTAATKNRLVAEWEQASRLYLATHVVHDPEAPYLSFLPLAAVPQTDRFENSLLEVRDILAADLRGCQLVVLSGCSSGTPYVEGSRVAPGLGDAFLDAGCRTTVQTFWRVNDNIAMELMGTFADRAAESSGPDHLARALRGARTSIRHRDPQFFHPFHWAANHVVTTGPER